MRMISSSKTIVTASHIKGANKDKGKAAPNWHSFVTEAEEAAWIAFPETLNTNHIKHDRATTKRSCKTFNKYEKRQEPNERNLRDYIVNIMADVATQQMNVEY